MLFAPKIPREAAAKRVGMALPPSGCRSIGSIRQAVALELAQVVAQLVQTVGALGKLEGCEDRLVDLLRGPAVKLGRRLPCDSECEGRYRPEGHPALLGADLVLENPRSPSAAAPAEPEAGNVIIEIDRIRARIRLGEDPAATKRWCPVMRRRLVSA